MYDTFFFILLLLTMRVAIEFCSSRGTSRCVCVFVVRCSFMFSLCEIQTIDIVSGAINELLYNKRNVEHNFVQRDKVFLYL